MYRIELAPGEEALFKNIDELAKGIHSGVVGSHARIWHAASNKWLPIDFHPHYKLAKERPEAPAAKPAPEPVAARTREIQFIQLEPAAPKHIEALVAMAERAAPPAAVHAAPVEVMIDISAPAFPVSRRTMGLIAAGILVTAAIGGAVMAGSGAETEAPTELAVASTSLAATPSSSFEIAASEPVPAPASPVSQQMSGFPADREVPAPAVVEDVAPRVIPKAPSLSTGQTLAIAGSSLTDAANVAQTELESRLRAAGLANLFAPARLTAGQVSSTRLAVAGASTLIRGYRAKETGAESASGARAADALLADIELLLGVLAEREGGYDVGAAEISFRDAETAKEYGTVRRRIAGRIAAGDSGSKVTESLIRVFGGAPPRESVPGEN